MKSTHNFHKPATTDTAKAKQTVAEEQIPLAQSAQPVQGEQSTQEVTREQLALGKRLLDWRTLVPLAIAIVALAYLAIHEKIDPRTTWSAIQKANIFFFFAAFIIYYLSFALRAFRWKLLLQNVGYTRQNGIQLPPFLRLVEIIYISFFANVVVPAKLGDLYRAYLLRQDIGVSTTRSFGTVLAERLLDLIVLLLIFIAAVIVSLRANMPAPIKSALIVALAVVVIGIMALFILRWRREQIAKLIPARFRDQYYHFQEGTLGSFQRLPVLAGLTIGVWACEALRFFFIALALNLIGGNIIHILAASIVIGLGEALLTAVPTTGGGVGLVEAGMTVMIGIYYTGSNLKDQALAAVLLDRAITFFSILLIGFIVFLFAFGRHSTKSPAQAAARHSNTLTR